MSETDRPGRTQPRLSGQFEGFGDVWKVELDDGDVREATPMERGAAVHHDALLWHIIERRNALSALVRDGQAALAITPCSQGATPLAPEIARAVWAGKSALKLGCDKAVGRATRELRRLVR